MHRILIVVGLASVIGMVAPASGQTRPPDRSVALTFDDLPMTGGSACDPALVGEVTADLTAELAARSLPAAGLATPGRSCLTVGQLRETLGRWLEVGALIGNHTATHPDINSTPIEAYLADVELGQALIDSVVSSEGRWFRPPYLHTGDDARAKAALERHIAEEGYRWAPVTVDNQEWVYAAVYEDARKRNDTGLMTRVVDAYVTHLEESMTFYERLSMDVFGREIPQTLLLHANLLNADHLDRVVAMLEGRGYRFIGMPEAVSDPAYAREDTYIGPRGLSWLQRWALEDGVTVPDEPREAEWVAEAFSRIQQRQQDEAEIREVLEHYLAGHATGLASHFEAAFGPDAELVWVSDGEVRTRTSQDYIAGASGRPAANEGDRVRRIAWIDVAGDVATARIELDYPGVFFVDYMVLARGADGWRIRTKAYHADRSGLTHPHAGSPSAGEDAAGPIARASQAFSEAYVHGDTARIRALYTPDAVLLPPGREIRGPEAIARYFAPAPGRRNVSHAMRSEELHIHGPVAVDRGTWYHVQDRGNNDIRESSGPYLVVWRLGGDGRWRIAYDMWHRPSS